MGGFFVKFEILLSILKSSYYYVGLIVLLLTVIAFFYYLRLIKIMFFENNLNANFLKKEDDFKLRIISYAVFLLPLFALFIQQPFNYIVYQILTSSF
jgi:NADH-quinone oxidoreductase subunit N